MNGKSILAWARWFRDQVKPTKEKPVMLVLDQHSSRFNLDFIEFCRENYIKIFLLAPNLTHLISVSTLVACFLPLVVILLIAVGDTVLAAS